MTTHYENGCSVKRCSCWWSQLVYADEQVPGLECLSNVCQVEWASHALGRQMAIRALATPQGHGTPCPATRCPAVEADARTPMSVSRARGGCTALSSCGVSIAVSCPVAGPNTKKEQGDRAARSATVTGPQQVDDRSAPRTPRHWVDIRRLGCAMPGEQSHCLEPIISSLSEGAHPERRWLLLPGRQAKRRRIARVQARHTIDSGRI